MFCTGCGNQLPDGANVCPNCGKPVDGTKKVDINGALNNVAGDFKKSVNSAKGGMGLPIILGLAGAVVALISVFLPFVTVSIFGYSQSVSLIQSGFWGILALVCAVAAGAFAFLNGGKLSLFGLIVSAVGVLVEIIEIISIKSNQLGSMYSVGIGAWLGIIGFAVAAVGCFLLMKNNKK